MLTLTRIPRQIAYQLRIIERADDIKLTAP
jgi:hypothetical protein